MDSKDTSWRYQPLEWSYRGSSDKDTALHKSIQYDIDQHEVILEEENESMDATAQKRKPQERKQLMQLSSRDMVHKSKTNFINYLKKSSAFDA